MRDETPTLTELEGHILAHVAKSRSTAYDIMKALNNSPLSALTVSPGAIYPAVKRLRERGFVKATPDTTGERQYEWLEATPEGLTAVRRWVSNVRETDLLPHDPLRAKLLYFDLLTPTEQVAWLEAVRSALATAEKHLAAIEAMHDNGLEGLATANARESVRSRRALIDRVRTGLAKGTKPSAG